MAIIATGSTTIIDLSDRKSLSVYLGSNLPKIQVFDTNATTYSIDWTVAPHLIITPVVYINQTPLALSDSNLSLSWKRKEGSGAATSLGANETLTSGVLTVNANKLAGVVSKLLTYVLDIDYNDPETGLLIEATTDITFSLVTTGENAKTIAISGEQVMKYASGESAPVPSSITLTAIVSGTTVKKWQYLNSSGSWIDIAGNGTTTTVSHDTPNYWIGTPPSLCKIKVESNTTGVEDVFTIAKVTDGTNPITGYLTNETVVVAAATNGTGYTLTSAGGTFKVYEGTTDKTTSSTFSITGGSDAGATWTKTQNGLKMTINETSGVYALTDSPAWGTDSETFTLVAVCGGVTLNKVYTISKSKVGATGSAGANAKTLNITASSNIFTRDSAGAITPSNAVITLTANKQNTAGTVAWTSSSNPALVFHSAPTGGSAVTTGDVVYLRAASFDTNTNVTITGTISADSLTSQVSVVSIKEGLSAIIPVMSNPNFTLPAGSDGKVSSHSGSGTTIRVFEGSTALTYVTSGPTAGQFTITARNQVPPSTITLGALSGSTSTTAVVADYSAMVDGTDSVAVTFELTIKRADNTEVLMSLVQTITKSKAGLTAQYVEISAPSQVFKYTTDSATPTPTSILLSASLIGGLTGYSWQWWNGSDWVNLSGAQSGSTYSLVPGNDAWSGTQLRVRCLSGTHSDEMTITKLYDGEGAIMAVLSNEAHVFAANKVGEVSSYAGSGTTIKVYDGSTELVYQNGTTAAGQWTVSAAVTQGTITIPAPTDSGTYATYGNASAMTTDFALVTYTISGKRKNGVAFATITPTQSFAKSKQGISAVTFSLYAPNGNVFQNHNNPPTLDIAISAYDGATAITPSSTPTPVYDWEKYVSGAWVNVNSAEQSQLTITAKCSTAGNVTVTLNGTAETVALTTAMNTPALVANAIRNTTFPGWSTGTGATAQIVTFSALDLTTKTNATYAAASTGAAGTMALVVDGGLNTGKMLVVPATEVAGTQAYRCNMTYSGVTYTDIINIIDKTDNYQVEIESTGGFIFKNTQGTSTLTARLWQNGVEVDPLGTTYTYKWYRRDKDGNTPALDPTPPTPWATGKTKTITGADVTVKTTFICEVE